MIEPHFFACTLHPAATKTDFPVAPNLLRTKRKRSARGHAQTSNQASERSVASGERSSSVRVPIQPPATTATTPTSIASMSGQTAGM